MKKTSIAFETLLEGHEEIKGIIGHWRKDGLRHNVAENLSELGASVGWKVELISDERGI